MATRIPLPLIIFCLEIAPSGSSWPTTFKAKPARNVVKVRPLKKLKDLVA